MQEQDICTSKMCIRVDTMKLPILLPIFLFVFLLAGCPGTPGNGGTEVPPGQLPSIAGEPFYGGATAKVTIIEFSDFQCPVCIRVYPEVKKVEAAYGDNIKFVFKHFPLYEIHPYAQKAAEASECAADQGKFFEYHDALFMAGGNLGTSKLKEYAALLGLDTTQFNDCLDGGLKAAQVEKERNEAISLGVEGTPTFYINNRRYVGYLTFDQMKQAIDSALAKN